MRFKYILILLLGCCCWRCNSIDDRFEEKDNLRLIMLEAIEEPYANPKDVYVYKLMAQSICYSGFKWIFKPSGENCNYRISHRCSPSARRINQPGFYGNCRQWEIPDYNLFDAGC